MIKWLKNNIKNMETLSSVERSILSVKQKMQQNRDTYLQLNLDKDDVFNLTSMQNERKSFNLEYFNLESELKLLETKRQHKLDRRNGFLNRFIWSGVVPVIITIFTAYLLK